MAEKTITCQRCGALTTKAGHLCQPCTDTEKCTFCGESDAGPRHVCKKKMEVMAYVCEGCGRVATQAELLCKPRSIPA